jgi:hypothetical protein
MVPVHTDQFPLILHILSQKSDKARLESGGEHKYRKGTGQKGFHIYEKIVLNIRAGLPSNILFIILPTTFPLSGFWPLLKLFHEIYYPSTLESLDKFTQNHKYGLL